MGKQAECVVCSAVPLKRVSLEINAVEIHLCAQAQHVPHNMVPLTQIQAREVPVHETVHT